MRLRPLAATAAFFVLAVALPGHAAPKKLVEYADDAGDSLPPQGSMDIVKVTWETTGKGVGKKYVPDTLVVTLELAAAPASQFVAYDVRSTAAGCGTAGTFDFAYTPGAFTGEGSLFMDCGSPEDPTTGTSTLLTLAAKVDGNKISWTIKLKSLPKEIKLGTSFSGLNADSQYVEPLTGILGTGILGADITDYASTDKTFKIA